VTLTAKKKSIRKMIPATMQRLPSAIPVSFPTRQIKKVNKEDDPSDDAEASQRHSRLLSN
jgi:hypothetical protein